MIQEIIFKCETCQYTNCVNMGVPGFVELDCIYRDLTDAFECVKAGHYVIAELDSEEEE